MAGTSGSNLYNTDSLWLEVTLSDISGTTSGWTAAPGSGVIRRMKVVLGGAAGSDTTFGLELGGTDVTDGGSADIVTMAASGSAAGDVGEGEADAANVVSEGDAIEVTCGGEGATASSALVLVEIAPA